MELHPLCTLFPRLAGGEFEALKADIEAHGLRQPIIVRDGLILDGGNRYRACVEAGIAPVLVDFTGADPVSFVLSANLHRRHLTPGQQAAIVASAQDWTRAHGAGGDRKSDQAATLPLDSVADRAAQSGASERTQRMADKVVRQSPELAQQVAHGEISLPKALEQLVPRAPAVVTSVPRNAAGSDQHNEPDLLAELEAAEKEIQRLTLLVATFTEEGDLAKQVADWSLKFDQLSGRNAQLIRTANEAQGQARYAGDLLTKIRKLLGVETNAEILAAISGRRAA